MIKLIKSAFYHKQDTKKQLVDFIAGAEMFSMGEQCRRFEEEFSRVQKRRYSVCVSSGSMANLVLIQALLNLGRLKKGDAIGFSALTWATNIMPLIQLGLTPVPIDCSLDSLNVSPEQLKPHIRDLKGMFLTNVLGLCDQIHIITALCEEHGVILLEDNCESLGSAAYGKLLGNFGAASTFSFYIGHHLSTIEGGMICTDDEELRDMLVMVRAHGWDRNLEPEKQEALRKHHAANDFYAKYLFYDLAFNARPNELTGVLGCAQIPYLAEIVQKRSDNFLRFHEAISANKSFIPLQVEHMDTISNFAMPVLCAESDVFSRYRSAFEDAEVEIRPIIAGDMTKQPFYGKYAQSAHSCANAARIHVHGFYFGNNPELSEEELGTLVRLLG